MGKDVIIACDFKQQKRDDGSFLKNSGSVDRM